MNQSQPTNCRGWLNGWMFTAEAEHLFQETGSPLVTRLGPEPLTIELFASGLRVELSLPSDQPSRCATGHSGVVITLTGTDKEDSVYFYRHDAKSLIIETEDRRFGFASDGNVQESADGSLVTASNGRQKIVMAIDWNASPVRMAILSGSGDEDELAGKARGLLFTSARVAVEKNARVAGPEALPGPESFFRSLLQPASAHVPFPTVLPADELTMEKAALLSMMTVAALPVDRPLAAGFIGNLADAAARTGTHAGAPAYPMLLQLVAYYHKSTGTWPRSPAHDFDAYTAHLKRLLGSGPEYRWPESARPLLAAIIDAEVESWHYIHRISGRPADAQLEEIRELARDQKSRDGHAAMGKSTGWMDFIKAPLRVRKKPEEQTSAVHSFTGQLEAASDPLERAAIWTFAITSSLETQQLPGPWTGALHEAAGRVWQRYRERAATTSRILLDVDGCIAIALGLWAHTAPSMEDRSGSRIMQAAARTAMRRPWITGGIALALVTLFTAWLVSVQLRTKLSEKAFITELGMLQQLYKSGDYDKANAKIDELERRGSMSKIPVSFIRGKILYRQKNFSAAAEHFAYCDREDPANPAYRYNLALACLGLGDPARAQALFESVAREFELSNPLISRRAAEAAKIIVSLGVTASGAATTNTSSGGSR